MGIPAYFVNLIKKYKSILHPIYSNIDYLFLDSNSIIYDSLSKIDYKAGNIENQLIKLVESKINHYITIINPKKKVYIAFDGVAPVSKLEQQRQRRYKSFIQSTVLSETQKWDKCAITPGSKFMDSLSNHLKNKFNTPKFILSTSNDPGEGEHKIFAFIRENNFDADDKLVIYGLDADLIMLSLCNLQYHDKIYLYRETPHFIKSVDKTLENDKLYLFNIPKFSESLQNEIENKFNKHDFLNDYILLCFLCGNDFLPHFPTISIRSDGLKFLLDNYKYYQSINSIPLTKDNQIQWKQLKKYINLIQNDEEKRLINEHNQRNNNKNFNKFRSLEDKYNAFPRIDREIENRINPYQIYWQSRYYSELFKIDINNGRKKQICLNYLEGIEWCLNYYTLGITNWDWCYNYSYPPLLQDLKDFIPDFKITFLENKKTAPIHPISQLAYVIPSASFHLLPSALSKYLLENHHQWYQDDYNFEWSYCTYTWESHLHLSKIQIPKLEKIVKKICKAF